MDKCTIYYRRFLDGDEYAFDDLMKELFRSLVFFIYGYVHNVHVAEDIAMDAFSDLIINKKRYNFKVTLKTYLFMIGKSRALDYIKRGKIIDFVDLSEAQNMKDDEEKLIEIVLADERKIRVNNAMSKLSEDMRAAVHLVFFEEMTYEEAAKVMKKNRKQIDNLLFRAKKELRAILGEDGGLL